MKLTRIKDYLFIITVFTYLKKDTTNINKLLCHNIYKIIPRPIQWYKKCSVNIQKHAYQCISIYKFKNIRDSCVQILRYSTLHLCIRINLGIDLVQGERRRKYVSAVIYKHVQYSIYASNKIINLIGIFNSMAINLIISQHTFPQS